MDAKDVIKEFCELQSEVFSVLYADSLEAADCFCDQGGFWTPGSYDATEENGYRNGGKPLEFIKQVVREKLELGKAKLEKERSGIKDSFFER